MMLFNQLFIIPARSYIFPAYAPVNVQNIQYNAPGSILPYISTFEDYVAAVTEIA